MSPDPFRPIVTLEEHFLSHIAAVAATPGPEDLQFRQMPGLREKFLDVGPARLADMDAGAVTLQVISHGPGDLNPQQCREANDQLAATIRECPARFAGFAKLPMADPEEAAVELRRTCGGGDASLNFVGALVDSHTNEGLYYDNPAYDFLWRAASSEDVDVPIYIHPTWPTPDTLQQSNNSSSLPESVNLDILTYAFGWHSDVAQHILRLYASGVFDRFRRLKIIIGHMGEMIPYMLQRIERISTSWNRTRSFREVWDENIWVTTSGNWALDPMACMLRNTKTDRIMYSVDYPFAKSVDGLTWLGELEGSGMVSGDELEGIRWRNAAGLLKLDVKAEQS